MGRAVGPKTAMVFGRSTCAKLRVLKDRQKQFPIPLRLEKLERRFAAHVPEDDILHGYFAESLGILDRLLAALSSLKRTTRGGEDELVETRLWEMHRLEAETLLSFLAEELKADERRKQLTYKVLEATAVGMIGDGQTNNRAILDQIIAECKKEQTPLRLVFPAGDYYFAGPEGAATGSIVLQDVHDLILEGEDGARILTSGSFMAGDSIRIERCGNLAFRNLILDMTPLPFVAGTITQKDRQASTIDVSLADYSPTPDASYEVMLAKRPLPVSIREKGGYAYIRDAGNGLAADRLEALGERRYRLRLVHGDLRHIPVGATAVLHPRGREGAGQGLKILHSRHLLFDQIQMHAAETVCVWPEYSGGLQFVNCDFMPAEGRAALVNADGFHVPRNSKGPHLENCRVLAPNDDCLNLYSPAFSVAAWDAPERVLKLVLDFPGHVEDFFQAGDPLVLLNSNTGVPDAIAVVQHVRRVPWAKNEPGVDLREEKTALALTLDREVKGILTRAALGHPKWASYNEYWKRDSEAYRIAKTIQAPYEHFAVNLRYVNSGFILRNCQFGHNRALGFKCKAGNGVIRDCRFIDQAVLFETSLTWREGVLPHDIEVTDTEIGWFCRAELGLVDKTVRDPSALKLMPRIFCKNCTVQDKPFSGFAYEKE